jgi:hypothetical protein
MLVILALVYIVTALNSCSYPQVPYPYPDDSVQLVPGVYRVEAVAVKEVECRGAAPEDFIGQVAYGALSADPEMGEHAVRFDFAGVPMQGRMESGWLNLRGALDVPVSETDAESPETTASSDCETADTAGGTSGVPECVPGTPRSGAVATINAEVISDIHAAGTLAVRTPDCSYLVDVTLDLDEDGDEPEPVEDTGSQPYPGQDTGSQPCGDGADCG